MRESASATEPDWRLGNRLDDVPLVLAGPIMRAVTPTTATVWLAFREPQSVRLRVYTTPDASGAWMAFGEASTVAVGRHLHLVAVTASALPAQQFTEGVTYYYDVELGGAKHLYDYNVVSRAIEEHQRRAALAYGTELYPSFTVPPSDLARLRILHGSCRRAQADEQDALGAVDALIAESWQHRNEFDSWAMLRPHLLLLTGDQIYADDVADAVLAMCTDFGDVLLGWDGGEALPGLPLPPAGYPPGGRTELLATAAGFTAGAAGKEDVSKSHLMGFGEYLAMYLLAWSPALWPDTVPRVTTSADEDEHDHVEDFRRLLPKVRRALANVPVYMCFDDHEVTDDWNLNRAWARTIWGDRTQPGKPLARRIITSAMLAYTLMQMWGNTPERFTGDEPGAHVLTLVPQWKGRPEQQSTLDQIADLVGVPNRGLVTDEVGMWRLPKAPGALRFDYTLTWPGRPFEIVFTDSRTHRAFDAEEMAPPAVMSDEAIVDQIEAPPDGADPPYVSFVVVPGPVLGVPWIEEAQEQSRRDDVWLNDAEAWGLRAKSFHRLVGQLAYRRRVIVLSGDVHYGYVIHGSWWLRRPYGAPLSLPEPLRAEIVQFTASAFKNETNSYWILDKTNDRLQGGGWNVLPLGDQLKGWERSDFERGSVVSPSDFAGWGTKLRGEDYRLAGARRRWRPRLLEEPASMLVNTPPERPKVFVPEHWRFRLRYLSGVRSKTGPVISPVTRPIAGEPRTWARFFGGIGAGLTAFSKGDDGTELVGNNNLGEIRFAAGSNPSQPAVTVSQLLWWGITEDGFPQYSTTHTVTLDPTRADAVPDQVWEQKS